MNRVSTARSPWLRCFRVREGATLRLVLFPHAGGSASFYRDWADALPECYELWIVQYPGRENRMAEPPVTRLEELAESAAEAIRCHVAPPHALFGHSMGSLVAYETARRLCATADDPVRLFASGRTAPGQPNTPGDVHRLDDDALRAVIEDLGATPAGILDDPEIRALVLPIVRGDYRLVETYRPADPTPLDIPVTALCGRDDPTVTPEQVKDWSACTTRDFTMDVLPGDHFFPVRHRAAVLGIVTRDLASSRDA